MRLKDFNARLDGTGRFLLHTDESTFKVSRKYKFSCTNNHIVEQRASDVLSKIFVLNRSSKGCPDCRELELKQQSLLVTQGHLPQGFSIVGFYRKEVDRKEARTVGVYELNCPLGHTFEKESGQLKDLTCPKCSETIYIGQERTRKVFEILFNGKFPTIRPDWLKNPKTKRNLELDGFNQELSLAFEFQGRQHFTENTEFAGQYEEQAKRDELKRALCEKFGVNLIEINQPTSYAPKKFIESVLEQIKEQTDSNKYPSVDFNIPKGQFNFKDITFDSISLTVKKFLDYLQDESPIKGYSCINTDFHTYEDKITMCCPEGHQFDTTAAEFKRNVKGLKGRSIPCIVCYSQENVVNTKVDLEFCREEGKKHSLELLSTEYKNVNEELEWKDSNGDIVRLAFRKLQRRKLEKKSNNKGIDLEYCREQGAKYKLELLSTEYINVHQKLLWRKENGDEIELYLRQIQRSKTGVF